MPLQEPIIHCKLKNVFKSSEKSMANSSGSSSHSSSTNESATPLQLPPSQLPTSPPTNVHINKSRHHRKSKNNESTSNYIQSSLQPNMEPIMKTPSLNSNRSPIPFHHHQRIQNAVSISSKPKRTKTTTAQSKYTIVNTSNPMSNSTQYQSHSDDAFIPMQSKRSLTLDQSHLIDEDQKIVETLQYNKRDENGNEHHRTLESGVNPTNLSKIPARGIPTTPSYPTPLNGPSKSVPIQSDPQILPLYGSVPNSSADPSVSGSQLSNSAYRKGSQFMETQQHRQRTNKLKFSRSKWAKHGTQILLNATKRVDRVCHALVQTKQKFGVCPTEMRQLSLTVVTLTLSLKAVIERAMYSYSLQIQEYKQKWRCSPRSSNGQNNNGANSYDNGVHFKYHSLKPSISAPSPLPLQQQQSSQQRDKDSNPSDNDFMDVNSEDSVETIGKCTVTSIGTSTFVRTDSPINHNKLRVHNANKRIFHNELSPSFQYAQQRSLTQIHSEQLNWRHPGGVVSLLEILGRTLRSTEEHLIAIANIATLTDFVQNNKIIWIISIVAGAYIFAVPFRGPIQFILDYFSFAIDRIAPNGVSNALISFLNNVTNKFFPTKLRKLLNKWINFLFFSFFRVFNRMHFRSKSVSFWMNRFRFMILPTFIYLIHRCVLKIYLMRLSKLQNNLNCVILHWQLTMTAISPRNRLDQSLRDRLKHIAQDPMHKNKDSQHHQIDIYQWILRLVPPSAHINSCFWYSSNFRLLLLRKLMDINYAVTCWYYRIFGSSNFFWPFCFPMLAYYILNPHRAACRANEFLANPDIRIIRVLYSILDSKLARYVTLRVFPKLRLIPQLKTAITFEIRVNDINAFERDDDMNVNVNVNKTETTKFGQIDTVRIKIFCTKKLNIKPDYVNSGDIDSSEFLNEKPPSNLMEHGTNIYPTHNIINEDDLLSIDDDDDDDAMEDDDDADNECLFSPINPTMIKKMESNNTMSSRTAVMIPKQENGVIFYIHGGGFLGNFCASDLRILSQWSELCGDVPIIEVDYSLIPNKWPCALQECILAYKCLCYGRLGFNARRIAVIGDSNGGGLAVSMILNIIQCGLRVPDVLILTSPILSLRQQQPTTSRLLFNMDPLIPMNLIVQLTKYYLIPSLCDDENDPLISPLIAAPDYLLCSFPSTTIVVGGLDPFLDDSIDFAHRLSNADVNVDVKLKIYPCAPHAFLNFNWILSDVHHAIHLIAECIDEAFLS